MPDMLPNTEEWSGEAIARSEHIGPNTTGDTVQAKRIASYETLDGVNWVRQGTKTATRIDDSATPIIYIGKAPIASATSAAVWQITRLDTTAGLIKMWASGTASFTQIWDNRASLSYS
jgi:hypothetical protein